MFTCTCMCDHACFNIISNYLKIVSRTYTIDNLSHVLPN